MKKICLSIFLCLMFLVTSENAASYEDIYGYWESDQKYPLNIIQFSANKYYYGEYSRPAIYSRKDGLIFVQFSKYSSLTILKKGDDCIEITFPDPGLPKKIPYRRISEEKAVKIIKKDQAGK